jgi:riboflavin biosynthesis pyrimidine reductase
MLCASHANVTPFERYVKRKEELAAAARLSGFYTVEDATAGRGLVPIGHAWTRGLFDGNFYRREPADTVHPAVSLVFVQSRGGNTVADNPSALGGGETDTHLIYEGLSRVDADAVLAGAGTARGERIVFSVWHPELVALRLARGHARHPAQVIVTGRGDLPIESGLMFNEPTLRVFLITRSLLAGLLAERVHRRPWVEVIDAGDPVSLDTALRLLRRRDIHVVSAVGGRHTATSLLREELVREVYLTTSPIEAGEPNTPFYEGSPPALTRVLAKAGRGAEADVRFEHFLVDAKPV